jgi:hypothetical protein
MFVLSLGILKTCTILKEPARSSCTTKVKILIFFYRFVIKFISSGKFKKSSRNLLPFFEQNFEICATPELKWNF